MTEHSSPVSGEADDYEKRIREKVWASECLSAGEWVYLVGLFHMARDVEDALRTNAQCVPSDDDLTANHAPPRSESAALPAQRQPDDRLIVGWRYAHKGLGDWHVQRQDPREWLARFSPIEYDVEPLYAVSSTDHEAIAKRWLDDPEVKAATHTRPDGGGA